MPRKLLKNRKPGTRKLKKKRKKKVVEEVLNVEATEEPPRSYYYDDNYELKPEVQDRRLKVLKKLRYLQLQAPESRLQKCKHTSTFNADPKFVPVSQTSSCHSNCEGSDCSYFIEKELRSQSTPRALKIRNEDVEDETVSILDQLDKQRERLWKSKMSFSKQSGCTEAAFSRFVENYQQRPFLRTPDSVYGNDAAYIEFFQDQELFL